MGSKVLRVFGPTYDVLYLIFLLLLPVSRTSPTSRTSLDRPVFSRASCSSTVRSLQTDTGRHDNSEPTLKLPGSVHGSARFVPPSHRFGSRSSSFAAAPAKTQNRTAIDSCVRSIWGPSSEQLDSPATSAPPRPEQPTTDGGSRRVDARKTELFRKKWAIQMFSCKNWTFQWIIVLNMLFMRV